MDGSRSRTGVLPARCPLRRGAGVEKLSTQHNGGLSQCCGGAARWPWCSGVEKLPTQHPVGSGQRRFNMKGGRRHPARERRGGARARRWITPKLPASGRGTNKRTPKPSAHRRAGGQASSRCPSSRGLRAARPSGGVWSTPASPTPMCWPWPARHVQSSAAPTSWSRCDMRIPASGRSRTSSTVWRAAASMPPCAAPWSLPGSSLRAAAATTGSPVVIRRGRGQAMTACRARGSGKMAS
jgi:hypothetical protein